MNLRIKSYSDHDIDAVRQFNVRVADSSRGPRFPETPISMSLPKTGDSDIYQEYFVAKDLTGHVRGAYILKHQTFVVNGVPVSIGMCQSPISEGIVDPRYILVGPLLLRDALRRQPLLYALGIGGLKEAYGRLLRAMRWRMSFIPFYFKICHPFPFLRSVSFLRHSVALRLMLDGLAFSGMGPLVLGAVRYATDVRILLMEQPHVEILDHFDARVDNLNGNSNHYYSFVALRDMRTLNVLYPSGRPFHRLLVSDRSGPVGWSVVLATRMTHHRQFGNMHVGSIVDCMASHGNEDMVIKGSTAFLESKGVDVIVSNQSHYMWRRAMLRSGFFRGASNYQFGVSPSLERLLGFSGTSLPCVHMTRGDGDGPIHL